MKIKICENKQSKCLAKARKMLVLHFVGIQCTDKFLFTALN